MKSPVFYNCTPHLIKLYSDGFCVRVSYEPSSFQPRCVEKPRRIDRFFSEVEYGEVTGLPPQAEGVFLIVSRLVKSALPARTDLVVPAELVKDRAGRVIGCRSFSRP